MESARAVLRVERGRASEEELAALAAVLLALRTRARPEKPGRPPAPGWDWRKGPGSYRAPRSWR